MPRNRTVVRSLSYRLPKKKRVHEKWLHFPSGERPRSRCCWRRPHSPGRIPRHITVIFGGKNVGHLIAKRTAITPTLISTSKTTAADPRSQKPSSSMRTACPLRGTSRAAPRSAARWRSILHARARWPNGSTPPARAARPSERPACIWRKVPVPGPTVSMRGRCCERRTSSCRHCRAAYCASRRARP